MSISVKSAKRAKRIKFRTFIIEASDCCHKAFKKANCAQFESRARYTTDNEQKQPLTSCYRCLLFRLALS